MYKRCTISGTNVKEAKALMGMSNIKILPIDNLDEAASMVNSIELKNLRQLCHLFFIFPTILVSITDFSRL